jgi:uncharacterized membrane protein YhaH (DUF805 family)
MRDCGSEEKRSTARDTTTDDCSCLVTVLSFRECQKVVTGTISGDNGWVREDADMGFGDAISTCFGKYATFAGRAVRSEFWFWVLFTFIVLIVLNIIQFTISSIGGSVLQLLFELATLVPAIAVAARRLHDTDRSGWWQLLNFIPLIGSIILLVWYCQPGTPGANRFG